MNTVRAIYENGVFRPLEAVDLPESSEVLLQPQPVLPALSPSGKERIYKILTKRFDSGQTDLAERHDEHQP